MSDELKMVEFSGGGRPVTILDLEQITGNVMKVRDSFKITPATASNIESSGTRRWDGSRNVGQKHGNSTVGARWKITGSTAQAALDNVATFLETMRYARSGRFIKWKPEGQPYPTYFEVRGPGEWTPDYRFIEFSQLFNVYVDGSWPVAPLALQDHMDIADDFAVDSLSDYTGAATNLSVANGLLVSGTTSIRTLVHTARGYQHVDGQVTMKINIGTTITVWSNRVGLQATSDGTNYLYAQINQGGSLSVGKLVSGTASSLGSTAAGAPAADTTVWLRYRREGPVVVAELFNTEPTPMATPAATVSATLTSAELTTFTAGGYAFFRAVAGDTTTFTYDDFVVEPYTYRNRTLPDTFNLAGTIPGDEGAPALLDLQVTPSGGAAAPAWALFGWWNRPLVWNRIANGNFEFVVSGWSVGPVSGVVSTATSITRVTTTAKFGVASGQVVTPGATTGEGTWYVMQMRFRKGVTYTMSAWLHASAGSPSLRLNLGVSGDLASGGTTTASTTWQQATTTWTPTADVDTAYAVVETNATVAATFQIDGVMVYEGSAAPTLSSQAGGSGGQPPIGIIPAESYWSTTTWGLTTSDANYHGNFGIRTTTSGAGTASAEWLIDPALIGPDDFTVQEIDVEVWARVELASGVVLPNLTLAANPIPTASYGPLRATGEYGTSGKPLVKPSSSTVFRTVRLGTLTFHVDPIRPTLWKLFLVGEWAVGSAGVFGIDQLILVPTSNRAISGPSGKPFDGNYPQFTFSTSETTRTLRADGSGAIEKPGNNPYPYVGMGRPLELPPGNVDTVLVLSSLVPDDPTSNSTSEQEDYSATVHFAVQPRVHLSRGS